MQCKVFIRERWHSDCLLPHPAEAQHAQVLAHFFSTGKPYAVETKQAKSCHFLRRWDPADFEGFRSNKWLQRNACNGTWSPAYIQSVSTICTACMKGVCVCVRVFREAGYEGEAGNVQYR